MLTKTREAITESALRESSASLVPAGTVLLTSRATIGFTAIAAVPMATNQGFANFICGPRVDAGFLAYWLEASRDRLLHLAGGTTFKEITKGTLRKLSISLPPLAEQRRIVDILDRAAGIRRLRRQAQDTARLIIPALFNKMFGDPATNPMGWPVARLGDAIVGFEGGRSMRADGDNEKVARYQVLKLSAVTSGSFRFEEVKPVPAEYEPAEKHIIRHGDLLITRSNTSELVGASCLVESPPDNLLLPDLIWRIVLNEDSSVLSRYLLAFLQHPQTRPKISALATGTSDSMRKLSQARLSTLAIPVPPKSLQRIFVNHVGAIRRVGERHVLASAVEERALAAIQSRVLG